MKITNYFAVAVLCILFAGCGADNESGNKSEEPEGVIPEHQLKALEKAKEVEQMLLDAEKARKKAMEEQGI